MQDNYTVSVSDNQLISSGVAKQHGQAIAKNKDLWALQEEARGQGGRTSIEDKQLPSTTSIAAKRDGSTPVQMAKSFQRRRNEYICRSFEIDDIQSG